MLKKVISFFINLIKGLISGLRALAHKVISPVVAKVAKIKENRRFKIEKDVDDHTETLITLGMLYNLYKSIVRRFNATTTLMNNKTSASYRILRVLFRLLERPELFLRAITTNYTNAIDSFIKNLFSGKNSTFVKAVIGVLTLVGASLIVVFIAMLL